MQYTTTTTQSTGLNNPEIVTAFNIGNVTEDISKIFGIDEYLLKVKCRMMSVRTARWMLWKIMYSRGYSLSHCGALFGGHDHTTVLHALEKLEDDIKNIQWVGEAWDQLKKYMGKQIRKTNERVKM